MVAVAADNVDGRAGAALQVADREPPMPSAASIPPGAVDAVVRADREQVQMAGIAGDRTSRVSRHRQAKRIPPWT